MQEKGQMCKNSDANLYTKKQAIIACLSNFLLYLLISNVLFPYIDKLVKMLDIFKMREKNFKKINDLESQAAKLSQSTRASSLGATETLFEMPNWRKNSTIK